MRHRAAFAARYGSGIADLSDAALIDRLEEWLVPLLHGKRRLDAIGPNMLTNALQALLGQIRVQRHPGEQFIFHKRYSAIFRGAIVVLAGSFGYYKRQIMSQIGLTADSFGEYAELLAAAWSWETALLARVSKVILRVEVLLQGQHYVVWVLFTALVGVAIILLGI